MRTARWVWLVIPLLALLASLSCGGGGGAKTARLLIMDQNVLHGFLNEDPAAEPYDRIGERIQLIGQALAKAQPDIITLQEILSTPPWPDYPKVRTALSNALGDKYTQIFGAVDGAPIGEGAIGQLTITKLHIISSENFHVSTVRAIHRVTVQTDVGPVDIYDIHLDGTGFEHPEAAVTEINTVLDFIDRTRSGGPVIMAGDFNAEPQDPSIQAVLKKGFVDALATAGDATCAKAGDPGCTSSTIPFGDNPNYNADHRIDYIFVLPGNGVTATVTEASLWDNKPVDIGGSHTLWPSDHIGVRAVLELKKIGKAPSQQSTASPLTPAP